MKQTIDATKAKRAKKEKDGAMPYFQIEKEKDEPDLRAPAVNQNDLDFLYSVSAKKTNIENVVRSMYTVPRGQITPGDQQALDLARQVYEAQLRKLGIRELSDGDKTRLGERRVVDVRSKRSENRRINFYLFLAL